MPSKQYLEYLKSPDWQQKRTKKLRRKAGKKQRCAVCGSEEHLDVHHLSYHKLTDVKQSDLRIFCRRCHDLTHRLIADGSIHFRNHDHGHRFTVTKNAIKKVLGLSFVKSEFPKKHPSQ